MMSTSRGLAAGLGAMRIAPLAALALAVGLTLPHATPATAAGEVNLYSSRHYDTDERLYSEFEAATGIKVNRIEDSGGALMKRMEAEGANSPADIFLTTDAGNLWIADQKGLFQPTSSSVLEAAIPANLRHSDGHWFGISARARVIFYDKARVPNPPQTYEELADPRYKGLVCTRTSSNIYMLSLMAALIEQLGEEKAKAWAAGVWANRAREPEGGDTDQLRGIASGNCGIAVSNTYYFARALRSEVKDLTGKTDGIGWVFPNQGDRGTHVNISGGGILKNAPNRENAVRFLEYLASPAAQEYFADGNDEYPVVAGVARGASVQSLGEFKWDSLPLVVLGKNQTRAQQIYDEVGYK